uniref:Dual O-methyltransferase/FAD-dependent monooxygenase CTB3 (Cercosporin toxin biosynthesis cluster protein 3) n=1 Tax=Ganoderma boninense TaxID=34458 RepID=A0A5K1K0X2_9APHY|nr:Dual O-methyltransferase/FAD-dependent monooxygenase CTB3 (Cercosporin toxin biosynthesis cluster protein 3) [Includes: O-methyltransferase (EC, FAD-dependent monooxygenase (EC ] [Ganoderma boninense]
MAHGYGLVNLPSPFTRKPNGRRQRSRLFRTQETTDALSDSRHPAGPPLAATRRPLTTSFTRHNPNKASHQRRQRSKRFRPRHTATYGTHAPPHAELSPAPQLLSVESQASSYLDIPRIAPPQASIPTVTRAEPLLLPEYAAPPTTSLAPSEPRPAFAHLPHTSEFPPAFHPPPRPNTIPRANIARRDSVTSAPRVHTQLNRDAWAYYLRDYPDSTFVEALLQIMDYGANIGFSGDRTASQSSQNLRSAFEHSTVVAADLQLQLAKGRVHGPFPIPPFNNFRSSPLGVAARKRSSKLRVIHHLSWPRGTSVNDGVPDSEASIVYETFRSAVDALRTSGRGSMMVKLDLEQAFRQIPVRPADWPLLGFTWLGEFYYHVVLTFGLRSAPYIFNLFSEALHWILDRHLPAFIRHLLDDFLQIFSPSTQPSLVHHALEWTLSLGTALGLRFQLSKVDGPTTLIDFLGIALDSQAMEARLPPDKLSYLLELLRSWECRTRCQLLELQELTGYLQFCSLVIPFSRAFIRSLFNFMASFTSPYAHRHIPRPVRRDISWWLNLATRWNGIAIIDPARPQIAIHTDASGTKGAGGVLQDMWFAVRIPRRYQHRDIKFKEFYAIIYAILCWGDHLRGGHVLFHTDNTDVHAALSNLTIRSEPMMELLRQFLSLSCRFDFTFESQWIPGSTNSLADAASRFQYQRLFDLAPYLQHKPSPKRHHVDGSLPSGTRPTVTIH